MLHRRDITGGLLLAALVAAAACCAAALAAQGEEATTRPGADDASLTRALLERPPVPVTPPQDDAPPREAAPEPPPPGTMLVDFACRMTAVRGAGWRIARLEPADAAAGGPTYWVLPCRLLESMEDRAVGDVIFRVSGEVEAYRGELFVLPRKVLLTEARPTAPKAPVPAPAPATQPAAPAGPDDVLEALRSERVSRPVLAPAGEPTPDAVPEPSEAPGAAPPAAPALVVDRVVRILPDSAAAWWLARYEADNTLRDQPVRLLPCRLLGRAEELCSGPAGETRAFRVSGEVTVYRGRHYLLLRKLIEQRQLGRF